jgi:hypothetical protein
LINISLGVVVLALATSVILSVFIPYQSDDEPAETE